MIYSVGMDGHEEPSQGATDQLTEGAGPFGVPRGFAGAINHATFLKNVWALAPPSHLLLHKPFHSL